jgi:hypothetical protein
LRILKKIAEKNIGTIISVFPNAIRKSEGVNNDLTLWKGFSEILKKREILEIAHVCLNEMAASPSLSLAIFQTLKVFSDKENLIPFVEAKLTTAVSGDLTDAGIRASVALGAAKQFLKTGLRLNDLEQHVCCIAASKSPAEAVLAI